MSLFLVGFEQMRSGTITGTGSSSACRLSKRRPLMVPQAAAPRFYGAQVYMCVGEFNHVYLMNQFQSQRAFCGRGVGLGGSGTCELLAILISYLVADTDRLDSITSNWEEHLFKEFHTNCLHLMFMVTAATTLLTVVSLAASDGFASALAFVQRRRNIACSSWTLNFLRVFKKF